MSAKKVILATVIAHEELFGQGLVVGTIGINWRKPSRGTDDKGSVRRASAHRQYCREGQLPVSSVVILKSEE